MNQISLEIPTADKISRINFWEYFPPISSVNKPLAVITDANLDKLYHAWLINNFPKALLYVIKPGEKSKSRKVKSKIEDFLLAHNFPRSGQIVAFGGGVVGDLAGYVAATYKRGVGVWQIPTSLLAMVDSSVGGKTAINTPAGKNLIGAFWQPAQVDISPKFLATLDDEQFMGGLAEVIKMALTFDEDFFYFLRENCQKILARDKKVIMHIIQKAVQKKAQVVKEDETEQGVRALLNFGHTAAHSIETASKHKIIHGKAVAMGMAIEAILAWQNGHLSCADTKEILQLLALLGYLNPLRYSPSQLIAIMQNDKKNKDGKIYFVCLSAIGTATPELASFTPAQISAALGYYQDYAKNNTQK